MIAAMSHATPLLLTLAGPPRLVVAGRGHALDGLGAVIAARLALEGPQPRSQLAGLLWPAADPARARANLRQRLLRLRQQAGVEWMAGDTTLVLSPDVRVAPIDDLHAAELLQGVELAEQDELARWLDGARRQQRHRRLALLQDAARAAEREQRWDDAVGCVQHHLAIEPLDEAAHRSLIRLHYLAHDSLRARAAFERLQAMLQREFGAAPSSETLALMQLVQQGTSPAWQDRPAPARDDLALARPPRLVGRERESAALRDAIERRQALLVLGEAGLGKSRLLAECLAPPPQGASVKAHAGDAGVPYATLARLLRQLLSHRQLPSAPGELARLLPEVGTALPLPADGERLLLQGAVEEVLAQAGLRMLAVDDLHFADDASLEMLAVLVASDALSSLAWVFTQRPGEGSPAASALRDCLEEAGRLRTLAVAPLDAEDMAELVRSLQIPALDADALGPRLVQHTGGNPLFALATLRQLLMAGTAGGRLPRPESVSALIDRRLRQLGEGALALARVAAIAGADFGPALAEAVLGRRAIELADGWAELEAAQILRDSAFAHDLMLEAALRSIPAAIGRHLHAAVAAHLVSVRGEAARIAAHWLQAGEEQQALPWLLQAADVARQGLRRREEAAFVRRAAEILDGSGQTGSHALWLRAAEALEVTDGVDAMLPLLDAAVAAAADEPQRVLALTRRASALMKRFQTPEAIRDASQALAGALARLDAAAVAEVLTVLTAALSVEGRVDEAVELLDRHWPLVQSLADPRPTPYIERGVVLDNAGRHAEARQSARRGVELALAQGWHSEAVIGYLNLATSHLDTGELLQSLELLDDAERLRVSHDGLNGAVVSGVGLRALALRDLGRSSAALVLFEQQIEHDSRQTPLRVPLAQLHRGWLWASIGQWTRALQDIRSQGDFAALPAWAWARALQLRSRIAAARGGAIRETLQSAWEALDAGALAVVREGIAIDCALAASACERGAAREALERLHERALDMGHHATRWSAAWALAKLALADADHAQAACRAAECLTRPAEHVALNMLDGTWWHGLWQAWLRIGDAGRAEAARAEGVAWIHRMLQRELQSEFHAAFRDAIAAHRELLLAH